MRNESVVYMIDATDRKLPVWTASVTEAKGGLVLRKAMRTGQLEELVEKRAFNSSLPIIVMGEYSAKESAGFTSQIGGRHFKEVSVVGGAGFGYVPKGGMTVRGNPLRQFKKSFRAVLCPKGTFVRQIEMYRGSNWGVADAALEGLKALSLLNEHFVLAEGQSDYVRGFEFVSPKGEHEYPEFKPEHRAWIFDPEVEDPDRKKREEEQRIEKEIEGFDQYLDPKYSALLMSESAQDVPQGS